MKKYFLNIAAIIILTISLTGCYTVIWDPSQPQLPNRESADENSGFYSDPYFGGYAFYYDSPWWYDISLPSSATGDNINIDRNPEISNIRNSGDGRGSVSRSIWNLITTPPSRSSQTGNIGKETSGNSNANTSAKSSERSSSSSNVRNNNGTRNTDKDKGRSR